MNKRRRETAVLHAGGFAGEEAAARATMPSHGRGGCGEEIAAREVPSLLHAAHRP